MQSGCGPVRARARSAASQRRTEIVVLRDSSGERNRIVRGERGGRLGTAERRERRGLAAQQIGIARRELEARVAARRARRVVVDRCRSSARAQHPRRELPGAFAAARAPARSPRSTATRVRAHRPAIASSTGGPGAGGTACAPRATSASASSARPCFDATCASCTSTIARGCARRARRERRSSTRLGFFEPFAHGRDQRHAVLVHPLPAGARPTRAPCRAARLRDQRDRLRRHGSSSTSRAPFAPARNALPSRCIAARQTSACIASVRLRWRSRAVTVSGSAASRRTSNA